MPKKTTRPTASSMDLVAKMLVLGNFDAFAASIGIPAGKTIGPVSTELIGSLKKQMPDLLVKRVTSGGQEYLLHMEFQTTAYEQVVERSLIYVSMAYRQYRLPVTSWIITDARVVLPSTSIVMADLTFTPHIFSLGQWKAADVLRQISDKMSAGEHLTPYERALFALLPMMNHREPNGSVAKKAVSIAKQMPKEEARESLYLLTLLAEHYLEDADLEILYEAERDTVIAERFMREGKQEGKLEGEQEKAREIARNMLRKGLDVDLIVEVTELSQEEVQQLAEEVQVEKQGS